MNLRTNKEEAGAEEQAVVRRGSGAEHLQDVRQMKKGNERLSKMVLKMPTMP
jgi:hypothetical protein